MNNKQKLGQFYTTNSEYIVGDLLDLYPSGSIVVDPFAGNWDLLNVCQQKNPLTYVMGFDIDPKTEATNQRDTLSDPPDYHNKWILTNPPYLAKNKSKSKALYEKYNTDDLYKASLKSIIGCQGGIIIVPLNFFSSRDDKIRKEFLSKYRILKLKVFEEQVFDDTSYTVCAFSFIRDENTNQTFDSLFTPSGVVKEFKIDAEDGYLLGSDFFNTIQSDLKEGIKIQRLTKENANKLFISKIFLKAVDTGTRQGMIKLELSENPFYGKVSDRAFATICFSKKINEKDQEKIVDSFNSTLEEWRSRYNSLFLTNFRNSTKECARKRIEFKTAYDLISHCMVKLNIDRSLKKYAEI